MLMETYGAPGLQVAHSPPIQNPCRGRYTDTVAGPSMVTIVVNHEATELVADSDKTSGRDQQ